MSIWTEPNVSSLPVSVWWVQSVSAWSVSQRFSAGVCLKGPLDVYLGWVRCFFLKGSISVCLIWCPTFLKVLSEGTEANVSFLLKSVWWDHSVSAWTGSQCFFSANVYLNGQSMSIWIELNVSFPQFVCLRGSLCVCLSWYPRFLLCLKVPIGCLSWSIPRFCF